MNIIEANSLGKRYGSTQALRDCTLSIPAGHVAALVGPNGAGKSTTMRMIIGLDRPTSGNITVHGRAYVDLPAPLREVGALLDAGALHGGRRAYFHLLCLAQSNGIPGRRVDEVLDMVGLTDVARKRTGGFSLGMSQRLGIAAALLGDPPVLMFDEPVNGLDPEGIRWIRTLMRALAAQGRTVLVSSHLMSEMALTADQIIVAVDTGDDTQGSVDDLTATAQGTVLVRASDLAGLTRALEAKKALVQATSDSGLTVTGLTSEEVGDTAFKAGITIHELTPQRASLEEVFMDLTADSVEYGTSMPGAMPRE